MARNVTIYRSKVVSPDTSEYARALITSKPSAPGEEAPDLDMAVRFSFDRNVWYDAAWTGDQTTGGTNKSRVAHLLMTDANLPADGMNYLFVRVTDNPEAPIIQAGNLTVR